MTVTVERDMKCRGERDDHEMTANNCPGCPGWTQTQAPHVKVLAYVVQLYSVSHWGTHQNRVRLKNRVNLCLEEVKWCVVCVCVYSVCV